VGSHPTPARKRAGYVLVGGRSSRMGRDKALLPFRGGTLARAVAREVELAAGSVLLVGNPGRYGSIGYPIVPDVYPGEGPLGGILTVLQHTRADWNLVVACDMPEVKAPFLRELLDAAEELELDALLPAGPSGLPEPLCAVYHRSSRQLLYRAFSDGVRKISAALEGLRTALYPVTESEHFQNVNTPEDWAGYASD
jgi:molybdopterin-guanine dinucleotide biosynthesis protein A